MRPNGSSSFLLAKQPARWPRAAAGSLGDRLAGGLVVTKDGHDEGPEALETIYASHPEPDERGVEAACKARELAESLGEGDLLLALISGGASALLADPVPPVEIEDLQRLTSDLLKSGAGIEEINCIRKHVSLLKGGGLASLVHPASTISLLLSDVVGDEPSSIASGLTTPDPTTLEDARETLDKYEIQPPGSVEEHLQKADENPKPDDEIFDNVANVVCGGGRHASEAAAEKARELGYEPLILSTLITGDAASSGELYAAVIREALESGNPVQPPCAIVSGGEATVTVRGDGTGGPKPGVCPLPRRRVGWCRRLDGLRHRQPTANDGFDRRGGRPGQRHDGPGGSRRWDRPGRRSRQQQRLPRARSCGRLDPHGTDRHQRQRLASSIGRLTSLLYGPAVTSGAWRGDNKKQHESKLGE